MGFNWSSFLKMFSIAYREPAELYGVQTMPPQVEEILINTFITGVVVALIGLVAGVALIIRICIKKKVKEQDIVELYGVPKSELEEPEEIEDTTDNKE